MLKAILETIYLVGNLLLLVSSAVGVLIAFHPSWILTIIGCGLPMVRSQSPSASLTSAEIHRLRWVFFAVATAWGFYDQSWWATALATTSLTLAVLGDRKATRLAPPKLRRQLVPNLSVQSIAPDGEKGELSLSFLHGSCHLIILFRGTWCGFCMAQIEEIHRHRGEFRRRGVQLTLMTMGNPETAIPLVKKYGDDFHYLFDEQGQLAQHFNLLHQDLIPGPLKLKYGRQDSFFPTVLLTNPSQEIIYKHQTEDYSVRPTYREFIDAYDDYMVQHVLEEKVRQKTVALGQMMESKQRLVRMLVHDLATPITIIKGAAAIGASSRNDAEKQEDCWTRVNRAADAQTDIVRSARKMEAVTSGAEEITLGSVELVEAIHHIRFLFRDRLSEKKINLLCNDEAFAGINIRAEASTLRNQVLANLVSNAIKFTPVGGEVRIEAKPTDNDLVCVSIADNGIGIPREMQAKLFEVGVPKSRKGTDGEKGTGFGLSLAKAYMEIYDGQIVVESQSQEDGQQETGTAFHLTFKRAA